MQIKDLVSFYVNESSLTLDVTFRLDSDLDDENKDRPNRV